MISLGRLHHWVERAAGLLVCSTVSKLPVPAGRHEMSRDLELHAYCQRKATRLNRFPFPDSWLCAAYHLYAGRADGGFGTQLARVRGR